MIDKRVGKRIKQCREEKGLTQEQLAERLCVTRQGVSNRENPYRISRSKQ